MAAYLTSAWFDEVNEAAGAARLPGDVAAEGAATIQQVVTEAPGGDVRYWVRVDGGGLRAGAGVAEGADATVTQSYPTAVAVSRGELAVEAALLAGRISVTGDAAAVLAHQRALHQAAAALAAVHERTTYP